MAAKPAKAKRLEVQTDADAFAMKYNIIVMSIKMMQMITTVVNKSLMSLPAVAANATWLAKQRHKERVIRNIIDSGLNSNSGAI